MSHFKGIENARRKTKTSSMCQPSKASLVCTASFPKVPTPVRMVTRDPFVSLYPSPPLQKVLHMKSSYSIEAVKTNQLSIPSGVGDTSHNFVSLFERNMSWSAISIVVIAFGPILFFAQSAKTFHLWSEVDQPPT